ncbi:MAG: hypothetical protein QM786_11345 [Breznakibacter sp.]
MGKNLLFMCLFLACIPAVAQESSKSAVSVGCEFNSRYVWRGLLFSGAPNLQPYVQYSKGGFAAMAWGSYATTGGYAETDLFLSYTVGNLTIGVNDYFSEDEFDMASTDFTEWKRDSTSHLVEAVLTYEALAGRFPLTLTASVMAYGNDLDEKGGQNYSTYMEVAHPFTHGDYDFLWFVGGTFNKGYYADQAALVNLGLKTTYKLKITESFSLPVSTSVIVHPYNRDIFMVVGVAF